VVKPELYGDRTSLRIETEAVALKTKMLPTSVLPPKPQVSRF